MGGNFTSGPRYTCASRWSSSGAPPSVMRALPWTTRYSARPLGLPPVSIERTTRGSAERWQPCATLRGGRPRSRHPRGLPTPRSPEGSFGLQCDQVGKMPGGQRLAHVFAELHATVLPSFTARCVAQPRHRPPTHCDACVRVIGRERFPLSPPYAGYASVQSRDVGSSAGWWLPNSGLILVSRRRVRWLAGSGLRRAGSGPAGVAAVPGPGDVLAAAAVARVP